MAKSESRPKLEIRNGLIWTLVFGLRLSASLLAFCFAALPISAQVQLTHDPLMNLMLAQPQIDVDSPVTPVAAFDPPAIRPGQSATYRVKVNALEASIEWPDLIESPNLSLRAGGRAQILAPIGGKLQPHTTFNYHAHAMQAGQYSVPAFTIQVYGKPVTIPSAQLSVVDDPAAFVSPEQLLRFDLAATNVYVGQPVRVRIALPATPGTPIQPVGMVEINGQGFIVDQSSVRQQLGAIPRPDGIGSMAGFIYETTLTPIATGTLTAFAQGIVGNRYTSGILLPSGPGGTVDYTLLDSQPVQLRVRPLPHEGELPGFTGAFAPLSVDSPGLSTNLLRVGDPVKLTVKIHGDPFNNLLRLVPPVAPETPDWQVLALTETPPPQQVQAQGFATFTYNLIPLTAKADRTPAIPFSCFDAERGTYRDISIPAVPVEILPGSAPPDLAAIAKARAVDAAVEKEPVLSGLATKQGLAEQSLVPVQRQIWFPLIQLVPALSFLGLWGWDRRRRYLEQHPDIVLRRRARRALRRHWRALSRAAQRRDAPRYAVAAVDALKVASAPHYPAQPQALVGADVIALLPLDERLGRTAEVVRRFFAVTDAARFGTASPNGQELFGLQPELERVLAQFEERLEPGANKKERGQMRGDKQRVALFLLAGIMLLLGCSNAPAASTAEALFQDGATAYRSGDYIHAIISFQAAAHRQPATGTLQNLGLAEWQQGRVGEAVLSWEKALWLDPFNKAARGNLRFARRTSQIESPDLAWYEVASSWLPVNWWAWSATLSLWLAVGMGVLPGIFRVRKAAWHQAVAALGLAVFLLTLPAHFGIEARSRIGFVLQKDTPLRLTPTEDAQFVTRLAPGEPARLERARGRFLLVRTGRAFGWLEKSELGFVCP